LHHSSTVIQPVADLWSYRWSWLVGLPGFCCGWPDVWNSLPDRFRNPDVTMDNLKRLLKMFSFSAYYQCN